MKVDFVEMTQGEYDSWYHSAVKDTAADLVKAGNADEEHALESMSKQFEESLPKGLDTPEQYVRSIVDASTGQKVGVIWYGTARGRPPDLLFLSELWVKEECRGKGYGAASLALLEEKARQLGKTRIGLHVFGHNLRAQKLYKSAGYVATNISMTKKL
jgi:ribosomal protein S18 acetylase RimI-like enzyme